jgi:hypothetical protein
MATAKKPPVVTEQTTELSTPTVEQVTSLAIQSYGITDKTIAELKADYGKLTIAGVEDKETYNTANSAISRIRGIRTSIESKRKEIKEPFLRAGQAIDAEAKRLTAEILPIEEHLKSQVKAIDEEAERRRKAEEIRRVQLLTSSGFTLLGQTYVAVNVVVHWDDMTRLTEDQLQQTIARGIAALQEQKAERERQKQAALDAERKAKELADLEAQLAAKRAELDAMTKAQQPTQPVEQMRNTILNPPPVRDWMDSGGDGSHLPTPPPPKVWGDPKNWNSGNVYPEVRPPHEFVHIAGPLPVFASPPPPANFTEYRQQNGFASQNEPATAPPIGTPAPTKSVYFMDGWEACKARIIKTFTEEQTPRKRAEWVEIFSNLKP